MPTEVDEPRTLNEAVSNLQQPGVSMTITGPDGNGAKMEDPRAVCVEVAEAIEGGSGEWSERGTDPWPRDEKGDPVEYVPSVLAARIGMELIRRILRLRHLHAFDVDYVYRNKETWESKGRTVFGKLQRPTGLLRHYSEQNFVVLLNWNVWQAMTPWQKVALVYHELRHSDPDGKTRGHDFEGFFDELELFGTGTYQEWHRLADATDKGARVESQYHLPLDRLS